MPYRAKTRPVRWPRRRRRFVPSKATSSTYSDILIVNDTGAESSSTSALNVDLGVAPTAGNVLILGVYNSNFQEEPTSVTDGLVQRAQKQTDSVTTVTVYTKISDGSE